jgi:hypothetical protein
MRYDVGQEYSPQQGAFMHAHSTLGGIIAAAVVTVCAQTPASLSQSQSTPARPVKAASLKTAPAASTTASQNDEMSVKRAVIALDVVDREPQDTGTVFPPQVKRLYCFTEICNGEGEEIQHRWYWNDDLLNTVSLKVASNRYRTYSSKTIVPGMVGEWRVAVVDSKNEAVLKMVNFMVK